MLGRIFSVLGIPALIVGIIWLGAVIYFQQTGADVDGAAIGVWFALVPTTAVIVWFAGKAILTRLGKPAGAAVDPAEKDLGAAPVARDAKLSLHLSIVSAEFRTSAGESAVDLVDALRKGSVSPDFSANLIDADGMPVKTASCAELAEDEYLPWVEQWLQSTGHAADLNPQDGAHLLALLHDPLERTVEALARLPAPAAEPTILNRSGRPESASRPLVTKVFAPLAWQDMLTAYVRAQVAQAGNFAFGVVRPDPERPELQADAIRIADGFCKASSDVYAQSILLIIACDSLVSQEQVNMLEAQSRLFSSANQSGVIPGEAAAIILATPPTLDSVDLLPLASIRRAAFGARQKPADAGGRTEASLLQELTSAALANAELDATAIGALVSDCDHRSAWLTESAMLISTSFEELDPVADHMAIGNALGSTGHASATLALALAAHAVSIDEKSNLAASMTDARMRSVAVLSPWRAPPAPLNNSVSNPS